jgi:asparagine synthase (glutamine-hydrolysing)
MCGIVAFFSGTGQAPPEGPLRMALEHMRRRGPDGEGFWQEEQCALGHRRLAIIDLDARAAQPMVSGCGRYAITFNGEIYNYRELREVLLREGVVFRTDSDTEVLLELFARRGPEALNSLRGMFAFALWDRVAKRGFVARDPYGIKPLYVARTAHGVLVGSQVRALMATGLVSQEPCARGQAGFWMLGSVPEPFTWFKDVRALKAGHYAWIEEGKLSTSTCWWNVREEWRGTGAAAPHDSVQEAVRRALQSSVAAHLVSDVPVGVFLSGGIDSGVLAALMTEAGAKDLQGVTVAYDEFSNTANDEAPGAAMLAAHYGIRHHVRRVKRDEFEEDLPRIMAAMDQPSIDGINTWYATKAVAELGLKVVVSGVGGDELFQGYPSFNLLPRMVSWWKSMSLIPGMQPLARWISELQAERTGNTRWRHAPDWAASIGGAWWLRRSIFGPGDLPELLAPAFGTMPADHIRVADCIRHIDEGLPSNPRMALSSIESTAYMRNQLLRDADWASMDHSVELRTPFVDAWLLRELKPFFGSFEQFPNKSLLAGAPARPLPEALLRRRKTGFGIPVEHWLRRTGPVTSKGHSRDWALRVAHTYSGHAS